MSVIVFWAILGNSHSWTCIQYSIFLANTQIRRSPATATSLTPRCCFVPFTSTDRQCTLPKPVGQLSNRPASSPKLMSKSLKTTIFIKKPIALTKTVSLFWGSSWSSDSTCQKGLKLHLHCSAGYTKQDRHSLRTEEDWAVDTSHFRCFSGKGWRCHVQAATQIFVS